VPNFPSEPAGYLLWCRCTAELHVLNDEYTRHWHLTMHINWRDNSSVAPTTASLACAACVEILFAFLMHYFFIFYLLCNFTITGMTVRKFGFSLGRGFSPKHSFSLAAVMTTLLDGDTERRRAFAGVDSSWKSTAANAWACQPARHECVVSRRRLRSRRRKRDLAVGDQETIQTGATETYAFSVCCWFVSMVS